MGNPWPDLAFKANRKDGEALVYRAHLIGQTEWSVSALIQTVLVSGKRGAQSAARRIRYDAAEDDDTAAVRPPADRTMSGSSRSKAPAPRPSR